MFYRLKMRPKESDEDALKALDLNPIAFDFSTTTELGNFMQIALLHGDVVCIAERIEGE